MAAYGRGTADDKAGIAAHAATLLAWDGAPPVTISVFIEGEEEIASPNIGDFLREHSDLLRLTSSCWPTALTGRSARRRSRLHCGGFSTSSSRSARWTTQFTVAFTEAPFPMPDGTVTADRVVARRPRNVAIEGLHSGPPYDIEVHEADIRRFASVRPSVSLMGTGTLAHRLWGRPAVAVLGIDAPPTAGAANKLVPVARAKISVRLAPGDDTAKAKAAIEEHLLSPARARGEQR